MAKCVKLEDLVPRLNAIGTISTMAKASDKALDVTSIKHKEIKKLIEKRSNGN